MFCFSEKTLKLFFWIKTFFFFFTILNYCSPNQIMICVQMLVPIASSNSFKVS